MAIPPYQDIFVPLLAICADDQVHSLIDGTKLAELMMDFNVGVTIQETYVHKKVDEGYFSEE